MASCKDYNINFFGLTGRIISAHQISNTRRIIRYFVYPNRSQPCPFKSSSKEAVIVPCGQPVSNWKITFGGLDLLALQHVVYIISHLSGDFIPSQLPINGSSWLVNKDPLSVYLNPTLASSRKTQILIAFFMKSSRIVFVLNFAKGFNNKPKKINSPFSQRLFQLTKYLKVPRRQVGALR